MKKVHFNFFHFNGGLNRKVGLVNVPGLSSCSSNFLTQIKFFARYCWIFFEENVVYDINTIVNNHSDRSLNSYHKYRQTSECVHIIIIGPIRNWSWKFLLPDVHKGWKNGILVVLLLIFVTVIDEENSNSFAHDDNTKCKI